MITNTQILCTLSPELKSGFFSPDSNPADFLFFDIETTGAQPQKQPGLSDWNAFSKRKQQGF